MTKRNEKKAEDMAEMKGHAGYHEMSSAEQAMYDTMLIAQAKLKAEDMAEMKAKKEAEKTEKGFDNMTDEEKKKFKEQYAKKMDDMSDRRDKWDKDDNDMRVQGGYFDKMNGTERGKFDGKMGEMQ